MPAPAQPERLYHPAAPQQGPVVPWESRAGGRGAPEPGNAFDIGDFLARSGTLYLIAEAQTEEAPVAPLMACS